MTSRHGASYQVIVLSPDKPPMVGMLISTKNIEKAVKLALLPYQGKLKSQNCVDSNNETIGQVFYRQTNDPFYEDNKTASRLTLSQNPIRGQAIVTALTKTKNREGTLTSEAITHIVNTYNSIHGIPAIPVPLARGPRGGVKKIGTSSKHPHKVRTAFEYFVREQAKTRTDPADRKEWETEWDALEDKSVYLSKEQEDKQRFESEMTAWNLKSQNEIKRPVGGRNQYILWQSANPKNGVIDKETYAKMWEDEKQKNPGKWAALAQQDKERAEKELEIYTTKMKAFKKFESNSPPLPTLGKRQREEESKPVKKMKKVEEAEADTEEDSSSSESEDEEEVDVK
jgi:hypothetical protein